MIVIFDSDLEVGTCSFTFYAFRKFEKCLHLLWVIG